jgi:hypothetical protein
MGGSPDDPGEADMEAALSNRALAGRFLWEPRPIFGSDSQPIPPTHIYSSSTITVDAQVYN